MEQERESESERDTHLTRASPTCAEEALCTPEAATLTVREEDDDDEALLDDDDDDDDDDALILDSTTSLLLLCRSQAAIHHTRRVLVQHKAMRARLQ